MFMNICIYHIKYTVEPPNTQTLPILSPPNTAPSLLLLLPSFLYHRKTSHYYTIQPFPCLCTVAPL